MLRQRGVPRLQGRGRGDLRAELVVEVPTKLSEQEAQLLRQLAELRGEAVGAADKGLHLAHQVGVPVDARTRSSVRASERQRASGQQRPAWPGNAMNEALRRSAAHVLVADVDVPQLDLTRVHHLARVLRLRRGQPVTVTDGAGRWRAGVLHRRRRRGRRRGGDGTSVGTLR